jgi:glycosyltransferase involved in cell wall biosynthesis
MLSIIMPSLNPDLDKIFFTLDSILLNIGDFEVILVLQRTTKQKEERIKKNFILNTNLKVIRDDGIGISRARNIAVNASIGEWILLLDDDVYIKNNTLHTISNDLSDNDLFYYGNVLIHNTDNHYVRYYIVNKDLGLLSYNRVCSVALIINRKVFNQIGLFDENIGSGTDYGSSEESDLILRALLNKIKIKYLSTFVVYHSQALHSLSKVEKYAMGAGALYRKYLFRLNLILYLKFMADFFIRLIFLCSFQKKRYVFFKGFIKGFMRYRDSI